MVLARRGQSREAEKEFREALRLFPKHPPSLTGLGDLALLADNDPATAEGFYDQALAIMPTFAGSHFGLGEIRARQGRLDEAIDHYRQAINDDTTLTLAHKRLGDLYYARKDFANARVAYSHVVSLQPNNPVGWTQLAGCELFLGRPREAAAALNRALLVDPTYEPARAAARMMQRLPRQ